MTSEPQLNKTMLTIHGYVIDSRVIIGISPVMKEQGKMTIRYSFTIYTSGNSIEIFHFCNAPSFNPDGEGKILRKWLDYYDICVLIINQIISTN